MKKISKIILAAAGIAALALVLVACSDSGESTGDESTAPLSSNTASSKPEADNTKLFNETVEKFVTALKNNDIVSMELVASKPLDTYGEWNKVRVSDVTYETVSVGNTEAEYSLTITADSVEDTDICVTGENKYTVKMSFSENTGEISFEFFKA